MARKKKGLIYNLEQVLDQLLKTNEKLSETTKALDKRLAQLENILIGTSAPAGRTRKVKKAKKAKKTKKRVKRVKKVATKKTCSVPGCNRPHYAKGLCAAHYQKMRREQKAKQAEASQA